MAHAKLSRKQQIFVVQQLAMYERPTTVQKALKEIYDVEISLPAILNYDLADSKPKAKWKRLFDETRANFLENTCAIPIANKAFRLRELDSIYHNQKLSKRQNPVEMRAILEQAAKESGNQFTNKSEVKIDSRELLSKLTGVDISQIPNGDAGDDIG